MVIASGMIDLAGAPSRSAHLEAMRPFLRRSDAAAEGGDRAGALVILVEGVADRQAGAALVGVGGLGGTGRHGRLDLALERAHREGAAGCFLLGDGGASTGAGTALPVTGLGLGAVAWR